MTQTTEQDRRRGPALARQGSGIRALGTAVRRDRLLYLLLVLPVAFFVVFHYVPMYGLSLAFRQWVPGGAMFGGRWRGLHYFESFLTDPTFWRAFRNTIMLSALNLLIGFPIPIVFALLLEEVRSLRFKRAVQTVSYLPRFVSLVVVIGLTKEFLSPNNGPVAALFTYLGWEPVHFLAEPGWFRPIYIGTEIWQWTGWQAIIYVAALANVNVELYESAALDGAGRFKQALHVSLPQMMPAIVIILVLRIGHILAVGFEKVLLLDNPLIRESSEIIQTYVFRMGILGGHFSFSTAVGFFDAVVGLLMVITANWFARRFSETSLW